MSKRYLLNILAAVILGLPGITAMAGNERLGMLSFNLRGRETDESGDLSWEARKIGCLKAIKKFDPDVICLQEAFAYHKADLMKEFRKHTLVDRSSKPGTVDQGIKYNENPIMFRADRFELLDYGFFWLNEDQSENKAGWDSEKPRNATWVKLRYKKSGVIVFCFNVQFDGGDEFGKKGSELMVDKIKEIAGDDAVVFLGGDFAMSASDKAATPLVSYVKDSNYSLKKPDTRASFNGFGKPGNSQLWPDHVFFRNAVPKAFVVADGSKFGRVYISDHNPVFAVFDIPIPKVN